MLNTQSELFKTAHVSKPSHDTIAFNTVTVRGIDGNMRAFRLYGKHRMTIVECDREFPEFVRNIHFGPLAQTHSYSLGFIRECGCCKGWHVQLPIKSWYAVTPALNSLVWGEAFPTRAEAVRAFAERYIAAGN